MRPFWERMSRTMALYRFDPIRLDSIQFVPIGYVYETMARDMRPFWGRMSRTMALYRFDPIRLDSIQFVPIGYVYQTVARDMRSFWDRMSRTMALTDLIRFDWIRSNSFLGVPKHGPGQALLLGTPVPNHGFVPI